MSDVGNFVQPSWSGHAYYGQTGEVIKHQDNHAGIPYYQVDTDGDASGDYWVAAHATSEGSQLHSGALNDGFQNLGIQASSLFDLVVPIVIAFTALVTLVHFTKFLKKR